MKRIFRFTKVIVTMSVLTSHPVGVTFWVRAVDLRASDALEVVLLVQVLVGALPRGGDICVLVILPRE